MKKLRLLLVTVALVGATVAHAQNALIDYQAFTWETSGFPPSNPGDSLFIAGVVDNADARFGLNLAAEELTLWVQNLVSTGQIDAGGGILSITYDSGSIELWRDPSKDHQYGTNPRNGTVPSTFRNGTLFLGGTLSNFFLFFDPASGSGAYQGDISFTTGGGLALLHQMNATGFTFGGVLDRNSSGGNIPLGYDLQADGMIEIEVVVPVQNQTWGAVKSLYRH